MQHDLAGSREQFAGPAQVHAVPVVELQHSEKNHIMPIV